MAETTPVLVVRCACGFEARGDADRVVEAIGEHAVEVHNMQTTREEILSRARPA